jgi:hypothetical protein
MACVSLKEALKRFFIPTKSATKGEAALPASDKTSAKAWVTIKKVVVEDW